jgi:hypothetical protein
MPLLQIALEDVAGSGLRGTRAVAREASRKMRKVNENNMVIRGEGDDTVQGCTNSMAQEQMWSRLLRFIHALHMSLEIY